jgi:hypothetical protein
MGTTLDSDIVNLGKFARIEMRVVALGHAGVGMSELARDHGHGDPAHGEDGCMGMAKNMESDCRGDTAACADLARGAQLLGALPGPPVVASQQRVVRGAMSSGASSVKVT